MLFDVYLSISTFKGFVWMVNTSDCVFWISGWHLCSICEKNAYYMCYTCTFSLCRACIKDAVILCVRVNKGFCETCMKTVMLIENNEQADKEVCMCTVLMIFFFFRIGFFPFVCVCARVATGGCRCSDEMVSLFLMNHET